MKFLIVTVIITCFLFNCLPVRAQKKERVDSLNRLLMASKPDSNQVIILYELGREYIYSFPDTTILYSRKALVLAQQIHFTRGESRAWDNLAFCEHEKNNLSAAFEYTQKSLQAAIQGNHLLEKATAYEKLAYLNGSLGYLQDALNYFKEAETLYRKLGNMESVSVMYVNTGEMYVDLAYSAEKEKKDSLYRLGLSYYLKALEIRREIRRTQKKDLSIVTTLTYTANTYEALGQDSLAQVYLTEAEEHAIRNNNLRGLFLQKILRAKLLFKKGRLAEAEKLALESPATEKAIYGKPTNIELYLLLSNIYQQKRDYQKAYEYRVVYQELLDKFLNNPEALKAAQSIRKNLEEEKRAAEVAETKKEKHVQKLYLIMIGGGLFVVLFVLGLVYRNNLRQKQNYRQLQEKNKEIIQQGEKLQHTLENLKSTQVQLIQSEKMAFLGEITAGIAHEIQNPLNFVNNFSEVNSELIADLKHEIGKGHLEDVKAIADNIDDNEQKVIFHGKRADAIVKSMLQHSRRSLGKKEPTDINALADEYLRLAYHGLRAKDKSFNATIKTEFDESLSALPAEQAGGEADIGKINIIPQDIGRVLLNLYNNAFYSVIEKKKQQQDNYEPIVSVSTKKTGNKVEIKVKDNGNGIAQKVLDKIFQPFFTTKPTGQGTGLGLSLAYDIVKAHGGEIKVETNEGKGSEFIIQLPNM